MLLSISWKCTDFIRLIVIGTDRSRHDVHVCLLSFTHDIVLIFTVDSEIDLGIFLRGEWHRISIACHVTLKYWQKQICVLCRATFADVIKYYRTNMMLLDTHKGNSCHVPKSLIKYVEYSTATRTPDSTQTVSHRLPRLNSESGTCRVSQSCVHLAY